MVAYPRRVAQQPSVASPAATGTGAARYAERLFVPWWLWLVALALAALAAAEIYLGAPGAPVLVPYLVLLPLTVLGLVLLGRIRVGVWDGELRVDDAHLPVRYIASVGVLSAEEKREALGPHADPYAFVVQRPWVRAAVLVLLDDPADPTPYWVVSARRPERFVAALRAAMAADTGTGSSPGTTGSDPGTTGPSADR
jgi:hypothetical protein